MSVVDERGDFVSQGKPKHLKTLERANDESLIAFWKATILLDECEADLEATREALAVLVAKEQKREAADKMGKARLEYLIAKAASEANREPR